MKTPEYPENVVFDENNIPFVTANAFPTQKIQEKILQHLGIGGTREEDDMEIDLFNGAYMNFEGYSVFAHRGKVDQHQDGVGYTYGMILHAEGDHWLVAENKRLKLETGTFFILNSDKLHHTECEDPDALIVFITKDFFHEGNRIALNSRAILEQYKINLPDITPTDFLKQTVEKLEARLKVNEDNDEFAVRPVSAVLDDLQEIVFLSAFYITEKRTRNFFEKAFKLMLELRVPREPESDEELREMIERSLSDSRPHLSSEEFWKRQKQHQENFARFRNQYHDYLNQEMWAEAAQMLLPSEDGISWNDVKVKMTTLSVSTNVEILKVDRVQETGEELSVLGTASTTELAMLSAIIQAHIEWHDIWKR